MIASINIHDAKTQLSKLLKTVTQGKEVIIAKSGKPIAKLVPLEDTKKGKRILGRLQNEITIKESFFDPLPDSFMKHFS